MVSRDEKNMKSSRWSRRLWKAAELEKIYSFAQGYTSQQDVNVGISSHLE